MTNKLFSSQVTPAGFVRAGMLDILQELQNLYHAAYGADVDLGPRSPDGMICGGLAEMFSDLNGIAQDTYRGLVDPNAATGQMLSGMARLTGIARNGASYSTAPATFAGTAGTVIPTSSVVQSSLDGSTWNPAAQVTIGAGGTATGTLRCTVAGPPAQGRVPAGSLTIIQTPVTGWASVTNSLGVIGYNVEGDPNLRVRRQQSVAIAAQPAVDAIQAAVLGVTGVLQADVRENASPVAATLGTETLGPNSLYVTCKVTADGPADPAHTSSADDPIAQAIFRTKGAGCVTQGSVTKYPTDSRGKSHATRYSLAVDVPVSVLVKVARRYNWPSDGPQRIVAAIVGWAAGKNADGKPNLPIGGDSDGSVSWTDVVGAFLNVVPGFELVSVRFSRDGGTTWTEDRENLSLAFNEIATIASGDVTVEMTR